MKQASVPKNSKDLATRLKEKKEKDRLMIQQEVENVVLNLKSNSKKSANTIRSDIEEMVIKRWTWTLAGISAGTLIVAGVLLLILWYLLSAVTDTKSALDQSKVSLATENMRLSTLEESIQRANGLSIVTDKTGGIWLQMRPGLGWGQTFKTADGTEQYQIVGR